MEIQKNPQLLKEVTKIETNVVKAINEALTQWLKDKIVTCPITNQFCKNSNIPCDDCSITNKNTF